ncbi:DUF3906 family protein [Salipaludibacillus sp. CUR1]|uniref:DUF3906 family protein n=1 Tax=Salipaludibacillus sp. CUR1 TaxID=2820003 RepID=UPI001E3050B5|nr:DUF3906 family protein [Salipaludibacillus sp. CUR1]
MILYRFEARINQEEDVSIVVAADNETDAFDAAEIELEKYYLKTPLIEELSLIETRKISRKTGFVIGR